MDAEALRAERRRRRVMEGAESRIATITGRPVRTPEGSASTDASRASSTSSLPPSSSSPAPRRRGCCGRVSTRSMVVRSLVVSVVAAVTWWLAVPVGTDVMWLADGHLAAVRPTGSVFTATVGSRYLLHVPAQDVDPAEWDDDDEVEGPLVPGRIASFVVGGPHGSLLYQVNVWSESGKGMTDVHALRRHFKYEIKREVSYGFLVGLGIVALQFVIFGLFWCC
eukprot:m51a1_g10801 hypothetical protein (223) ;mRNA; r:28260-29005